MTLEALVAYLMTHSERIAAVRERRETEAQQEEYLTEALRPFFVAVERRQLGFFIRVETPVGSSRDYRQAESRHSVAGVPDDGDAR